MNKYDVLIIGGGTAGCACAWNCGKLGLSSLIIEKGECLGGTMTSGLVVPVMNTGKNLINIDFYNTLISEMHKFGGQYTYQGNPGWFNPELLKIVLDRLMADANVKVLFDTEVCYAHVTNNHISHVDINTNILSPHIASLYGNKNTLVNNDILSERIEARYYIDATGDGNFSKKINCEILDDENKFQPMSLRFLMSGINLEKFSKFILDLDKDRSVTTVEHTEGVIHLSTAYTWDTDKTWALAPLFDLAVNNNELKDSDRNYFQVFSVAGMPDTLAFNCPRIVELLNPNLTNDRSIALKSAREAIYRLSEFCKKNFPGFEKAYISNIANALGVRVSTRIKGKYVYTIDDLRSGKIFENPALISNYPVDVHSSQKGQSTLERNGEYQLPIESLMSNDYDNLFIAGRCLSADYLAQGALRVQANCFAMGEAVAKYLKSIS